MSEYENREARFNANLGQVIGGFATSAVHADTLAKLAYVERTQMLLEQDNVDFTTETSLVNMDTPLQTRISVPPITLLDNRPLEIDEASIELSMTVHAATDETLNTNLSTQTDGSLNYGLFGQGAAIKISAKMTVDKSHKRHSDYTSTTTARLVMRQGMVAEGMARVMDALSRQTEKALALNEIILDRQADKLAQDTSELGDNDLVLPEPNNDDNSPDDISGGNDGTQGNN